jgi:hypothetical protein
MTADPEASGAVPVPDPWHPAVPGSRSPLMLAAGACWLASAICISVMAARGASVAWVIAWFTATAAAVAVTRMSDVRLSRRGSSRVIEPSSLDDSARQLLRRAQLAIGAILGSEVYAADLLDRAAAEAALNRHEWEIASTLREITALRAEARTSPPGSSAGPMTDPYWSRIVAPWTWPSKPPRPGCPPWSATQSRSGSRTRPGSTGRAR